MLQTRLFCFGITPSLLILLLFLTSMFACFMAVNATKQLPYANYRYGDNATEEKLTGKLVFAHVIFRHGDRTIIEPYPNDPWGKPEFWPTGWGQLTNRGKEQHYELGQWLRKRYASLLDAHFKTDNIFIQSTDVDRTIMSALSNLAGMYEPLGDDIWNKDIKWQPIPVHSIPEKYDRILASKAACPAYDYAYAALQKSPEFQKLNRRYAYLYSYLTQYTGRSINSMESVQRINNTFFIETLYNRTLPDWARKVYLSPDMNYISKFFFSIFTYTRQMARLKTGPLIKEVLNRFNDKMQNKLQPNRSVWIYSAHDTTIANVLNTLKLFELHSPPYTACIMLELRISDDNAPFVSIFYRNTTAEPLPLNIPGCGVACPLNKMSELYKDILPVDWEQECQLSTMMMTYEEANIGQATAILIAVIIFMLFLSYVLMIYYRRRDYRLYSSYSQMT